MDYDLQNKLYAVSLEFYLAEEGRILTADHRHIWATWAFGLPEKIFMYFLINNLPLTEYTVLNAKYVKYLFDNECLILKSSIEALKILNQLEMPLTKLNIKFVKTLHTMRVPIDKDNIISCLALFNLEIDFTPENIAAMRLSLGI